MPEDNFANHNTGLESPLGRFQRLAASNEDEHFTTRAILLTADTGFTLYSKENSGGFAIASGELAPNVWHPMRCYLIESNTAEILIAD